MTWIRLSKRCSMSRLQRGCLRLALSVAAFGGAGCEWQEASREDADTWIETARLAHEEADRANSAAARTQALARLRQALTQVPTRGAANVWVRQDLSARLAQLHLEAGEPEQALEWCRSGLALNREPSVAVANLLVLSGRAHEARGEDDVAIEAYHEALLMNEALMEHSLGGTP